MRGVRRKPAHSGGSSRALVGFLNLAASIQVTWFYVAFVPSALNLQQYEQGHERTPFQQRILMAFPLRWAHDSAWLNQLAHRLTSMAAWFPRGVRSEGIVESAINLACVLTACLVARKLYDSASSQRLFSAYVYPLTLLMIVATYCFNTMHRFRFVFDLPSLAFFALGMYLIYFRRSRLLFALLFAVATINRETTLFLLLFYLLKQWSDQPSDQQGLKPPMVWKGSVDLQTVGFLGSLSMFWILWHIFINRRFSANQTAAGPRFWLNIGTLLWPTSWAQILCTFAFCTPLCLMGRKFIRDRTLRIWYLILPFWFLAMLRFGILIEVRIFGELIPYLACMATLIAEESLLQKLSGEKTVFQ